MKNFKEYSEHKCKNFGFTFSIIFFLLALYNYVNDLFFFEIALALFILFLIITKVRPSIFKFLAFYWEKFGIILGLFFSPIILSFVYLVTIMPINLIIRVLGIDLIKKKKDRKIRSYWELRKNDINNFKDQF
jgi:membrane-associated phospholipid phosphatase|tara:strand:+ start:3031 stop:3426 length:396 start_codon:yes stop_codon:yes gene_type:complete